MWKESALKGLFSESHQSFLLHSPLLQAQPARASVGIFIGYPHLSPQSSRAAAEKVATLSALSPIRAILSISVMQLSCKIDLEEISVTKFKDKLGRRGVI